MDQLIEYLVNIRTILEIKVFNLGSKDVTLLRVLIFFFLLLSLKSLIKYNRNIIIKVFALKAKKPLAVNVVRIFDIFLWVIGLIVLLDIIGIGVSSILTLLAALGIGIGFGLQSIIQNGFGGVILLFEQPIRIGDIIETNGMICKVKHIGWRATLVMTLDNSEILIPNSNILDVPLVNLSLSEEKVRIRVKFGVHYKSNPDEVKKVVLEVANKNKDVLVEPIADVHFMAYGDSSIDFHLLAWIDRSWEKGAIKSALYFQIFEAFRENGIEIPYPQRDLHLITGERDILKES